MKYGKDITKIDECIEYSKRQLERACKERVDAVAQFVGTHYSDEGAKKSVPTNLLELAVTIYLRLLAARTPHCSVTTDEPSLKPFAANFEVVLNQIPDEIGLRSTIRRAVMEAMFSIGVVKVGIAGTDPRPNFGDEPFVSLVQLDDYFVDMSAKSWDEIQYEGNEYWMEADAVKELYGEDIAADSYAGDSATGVEQANSISSREARQELHGRVLLRDVYLVRENLMVTYAVESKKELRRVPWDGPEGSPYIKLWFSDVPGNLMPLAPIAVWRDLHEFANQIFRKIAKQAVSKKTLAGVVGGDDEEVSRIKNAPDGGAIRVNGARIEKIDIGGVDNGNLAVYLNAWNRFSLLAGNLDSLGGLGPQSSTASQDKLINESASARIASMSERTVEFVKEIFERLAWYVWTDPVRERKYRRVYSREFNLGVSKQWTPETRDGDFLDYNFDVSVFSMQDDSPATRVQKLTEIMNSFVFPQLQMMMQQGLYVDQIFLMDYISKNTNMPELKDIVKEAQPQPGPMKESAALPQPSYVSTKPPVTKRVYERVNRPGKMTNSGADAVMANVLMGGNAQPDDLAGMTGENI